MNYTCVIYVPAYWLYYNIGLYSILKIINMVLMSSCWFVCSFENNKINYDTITLVLNFMNLYINLERIIQF